MDPPPTTTTTTTTTDHADHSTKLRLMCSYGGHIVPRPNSKSLCYVGGDTRIVAVDRHTAACTSLSSFTTHLSSTLLHTTTTTQRPFMIKYQLPHHDLDSLISLVTDDDLLLMLEEYDRLMSAAAAATTSRLRLFLFPAKNVEHDSSFDAWFIDAIKSSKIMRKKGGFDDSGFDSASVESPSDLGSVPESIVLETNSSFGSSSSSGTLSNLSSIKVHAEEGGGVNLMDNKVKVSSPDSIVSDNSVPSGSFHPQTGIYQDPVVHVASNPVESEHNVSYSGTQIQEIVQVSGYPITPQLAQHQQQPPLQFVPVGAHYIPHQPSIPLPISSYHPNLMYQPQLQQQQQQLHFQPNQQQQQQIHYQPNQQQQQQIHYQPNQPCPVYLLPVGHTQPYNLPMQYSLIDAGHVVSSQPPVHSNVAMIAPQMDYKEVTATAPIHESSMNVYGTATEAIPLVHVPSNQNQKPLVGLPQIHPSSQSVATSPMETTNYCKKLDDDPAYTQIYKSQPPAPSLPSQHQTMTKATTLLSSETLTKLHVDGANQ